MKLRTTSAPIRFAIAARRIGFDSYDEARALQSGTCGRAETDWSLCENRSRVSDLEIGAFGGGNSSRSDIGQQDHLLVGKQAGDFGEIRLRIRHEKIFGLRAIDRIAELPTADWAAALRQMAAGSDGADENSVPDSITGDSFAEFVDDSDRFMADHQSGPDLVLSLQNVNIGAANRCKGHADHRFTHSGRGNRHAFDGNIIRAAKHERPHGAARPGKPSILF